MKKRLLFLLMSLLSCAYAMADWECYGCSDPLEPGSAYTCVECREWFCDDCVCDDCYRCVSDHGDVEFGECGGEDPQDLIPCFECGALYPEDVIIVCEIGCKEQFCIDCVCAECELACPDCREDHYCDICDEVCLIKAGNWEDCYECGAHMCEECMMGCSWCDAFACPDDLCDEGGEPHCNNCHVLCSVCGNCSSEEIEICENCEEPYCVNCFGGECENCNMSVCNFCVVNFHEECMYCEYCHEDLWCVGCNTCLVIEPKCIDEYAGPGEHNDHCQDCSAVCIGCVECYFDSDEEFCEYCEYCPSCQESYETHCPECNECYENVRQCEDDGEHCTGCCEMCENCGFCVLTSDEELCEYCEFCPNCQEDTHCTECGECYWNVGQCDDDGEHCKECCVICENCHNCILIFGEELCDYCEYCPDCQEEKHCPECEECYEDVGQCEYGQKHCQKCCVICKNCNNCVLGKELCDDCGYCPNCHCKECGACKISSNGLCADCLKDPAVANKYGVSVCLICGQTGKFCKTCGLCGACSDYGQSSHKCSCGTCISPDSPMLPYRQIAESRCETCGLCNLCCVCESGLRIDEVNFPNPELREYLLNHERIKDSVLSDREIMNSVSSIDLSSGSLKGMDLLKCGYLRISGDVTDWEYAFTDYLKSLDVLDNNNIEILDLSSAKNLRSLNVVDVSMEEIILSDNSNFDEFVSSGVKGLSVDFSGAPNVNYIQVDNSEFTSFDLSSLEKLDYVEFISVNLPAIDVSNSTDLGYLYIDEATISTLDLTNSSALEYLFVTRTELMCLDLSTCPLSDLDAAEMDGVTVGSRKVEAPAAGKFSFKDLEPTIDETKISNVQGAKLVDASKGIWELTSADNKVTYLYETGNKVVPQLSFEIVFEESLSKTYELTVLADNESVGTVTGAGEYADGESVEVTATATDDCYEFEKWSDGNKKASRTVKVAEDMELVAYFKQKEFQLTIETPAATVGAVEVKLADAAYVDVTAMDEFVSNEDETGYATVTVGCGSEVSLKPIMEKPYLFAGWSVSGKTYDEENLFVVASDMTISMEHKKQILTEAKDVEAESVVVYSSDMTIYVEHAKSDIYVYDMSSRLVSSVSVSGEQSTYKVAVPVSAVYLVQCGSYTARVIVK